MLVQSMGSRLNNQFRIQFKNLTSYFSVLAIRNSMVTKKTEKTSKSEEKTTLVKLPEGKYYFGLGRRKRSIALVRLYPVADKSKTMVMVNQKPLTEFDTPERQVTALRPLEITKLLERFFISAIVRGGGKTGQTDAISLGIARALVAYDSSLKKVLKDKGFLTRDPREKERKKYGLRRARKAHQYTKR